LSIVSSEIFGGVFATFAPSVVSREATLPGVGAGVAAKQKSLQDEQTLMSRPKEDLAEQVIDLRELVTYQSGSIVSRMLVYTRSGTITIFAFDEGQGLSEHTAPYDAILQVLDGEALITITGAEYPMKDGDLIIMPANKPHAVHAITRFKMMLTMIHA